MLDKEKNVRDETRYVHPAVQEAAGVIREALAAGEDAAVVSADNMAMWAAACVAAGRLATMPSSCEARARGRGA